jgi:hypothetical protein
LAITRGTGRAVRVLGARRPAGLPVPAPKAPRACDRCTGDARTAPVARAGDELILRTGARATGRERRIRAHVGVRAVARAHARRAATAARGPRALRCALHRGTGSRSLRQVARLALAVALRLAANAVDAETAAALVGATARVPEFCAWLARLARATKRARLTVCIGRTRGATCAATAAKRHTPSCRARSRHRCSPRRACPTARRCGTRHCRRTCRPPCTRQESQGPACRRFADSC